MDLRHSLSPRPGAAATGTRSTSDAQPMNRPWSRCRSQGGRDEAFLSELDASISRAPVGAARARRVHAARGTIGPGSVSSSQPLIFRKGLDMKEAVAGELAAAYDSAIVDRVRANDFRTTPAG